MANEVFLTRGGSVAGVVARLLERATTSVDAALYRFNNPQLSRALEQAASRAVKVRLVLDRGKYQDDQVTRKLLSGGGIPWRTLSGRRGPATKMHHKFIILDRRSVLTGSYNWTLESEEENYDNLVLLREPELVEIYRREFEALWREATGQL
jgi:phosphatidylserine/phosphatidylglycerophosphate/cardiolipin synthase-like enzyme